MITEAMRRAFAQEEFTPADAAVVLGISSPYSTLNRLKSAGIIERAGRARYRFTRLGEPAVARRLATEERRRIGAERLDAMSLLARARWRGWVDAGRLRRTGARRYVMTAATDARPVTLRVRRSPAA